jgi:hypothetical protein
VARLLLLQSVFDFHFAPHIALELAFRGFGLIGVSHDVLPSEKGDGE